MHPEENPEDLIDKTDAQLGEWLERLEGHLASCERRMKSKDTGAALRQQVAHMNHTAKTVRKEFERRRKV